MSRLNWMKLFIAAKFLLSSLFSFPGMAYGAERLNAAASAISQSIAALEQPTPDAKTQYVAAKDCTPLSVAVAPGLPKFARSFFARALRVMAPTPAHELAMPDRRRVRFVPALAVF